MASIRHAHIVTENQPPARRYSPNINLASMTASFSAVNIPQLLGLPQLSLGPGQIGSTYIPNMNASMRITVPFLAPHRESAMLAAAGVSHPAQLPDSFDWRKSDDVKKSPSFKGETSIPSPLLFGVDNQYTCGGCWAMSSATMISDRWAIARKEPNPKLSTTPIVSCATRGGVRGCDGGFPADAGHYLEKDGTTTNACWPFSGWCSGVKHCAKEPPLCTVVVKGKCSPKSPHGTSPVRYKAVANTTRSLGKGTIDQIKQRIKVSIFAHGPAVVAFSVFGDFIQFGLHAPAGKENTNIYAHVSNPAGPHAPHQHPWASGLGGLTSDDKLVGRHAVVIVGWGKGNHPKYGQLEYWIVRNSWGPTWNGTGYWRHAVSVPSKGINVDTGLDLPIDLGRGLLFGGATVWDADKSSGPPPSAKPSPTPSPKPSPTPSPKPSPTPATTSSKRHQWIHLAVTIGAILIVLAILFVLLRKRKTSK